MARISPARLSRYRNACGGPSRPASAARWAGSPAPGAAWRWVALLAVLLLGISVRSASAQDIWFGPKSQDPELMDLFKPDAPWGMAASHVKAFEMLVNQGRPKQDLIQIFRDLRHRHMDLVVGLEPLSSRGPGGCGYHIEGYGAPGGVDWEVHFIKSLGGEPRYFSLDGPLHAGHFVGQGVDGHFGCKSSIADVAKDIATKVRQIHAVFPNAQIIDIEAAYGMTDADLQTWLDDYAASTGEKLPFMRFDMDWNAPWQARIPAIVQLLRRNGVGVQVIYNGSGNDRTDEQWIADATARFKAFETVIKPPPAAVVIQSWNPRPSHLLPESDPRTLTSLIDRYVAWRQTGH